MDDFTVYGNSFDICLKHLELVLKRCVEKSLVLNYEKCHFMVREGIVLGHVISERGIEVDKAKVDSIAKLPYPTTVKHIRAFLGHAGGELGIGTVWKRAYRGRYRLVYPERAAAARPEPRRPLEPEGPRLVSSESVMLLAEMKEVKDELLMLSAEITTLREAMEAGFKAIMDRLNAEARSSNQND
ncbi:uncharacterized protein LOC131018652 [Salvia miltiorrhiza]|uniref:uncharacterized protein LOC131018652 n=1 Tax=Salvia miltiorrhiza TaxID=226208 RepID=UPI0025AC6653|nr:uncharacterized protein LOC131018652 [Salvia miltiorrhiza]